MQRSVVVILALAVAALSVAACQDEQARPRFGFRAQLAWDAGGDLDLHLVERGSTLFGARDVSFENRAVDFGATGVAADDGVLLDDSGAAPGPEQIVIAEPATGTYEIWVHVFDDGGLSAREATVTVVLDDAAPAMLQVRQMPGACSTWHVADITFPDATINVLDGAFGTQCR
jgi:uncharacterized protein YfaP (DUF2135 family)